MFSSLRRNLCCFQPVPFGAGLHTIRGPKARELRRGNVCFRVGCMAPNVDENGKNSTVHQQTDSQLKQTVADLDAILGTEEEEEELKKAEGLRIEQKAQEVKEISKETTEEILSLSAEIVQKIKTDETITDEKSKEELFEKMVNIVQNAKDIASGEVDSKKILESLESLLESVSSRPKTDAGADVQRMRDKLFTADTFWVTEMIEPTDTFGGYRFRGNVRSKSEVEAFEKINTRLKAIFDDKYELFMFEEPLTPEQQLEPNAKPRVCVQIVPRDVARPPESPNWQPIAAGVLFLFTLATAYILGVSSNVGNIPPAVVEYLSQPNNLNTEEWPDFVKNWNPSLFLTSAGTIAVSVMFLQLAHDLGHRIIAYLKKIKLKGSLLLPSTQLGTLGSVTQLGSLVKTRTDLWDLAFGGLAAGGIASLVMLVAGIFISTDASTPRELLVPVPSVLLQGSTLIGGSLQAIFGDTAAQRLIYLHPFTIAGWCGLSAMALNSLPVGNLDGGRLMYSAFGRQSLNLSSIFTYFGLALGVIGSSVALPFGLYVLICQRDPEVYIQNQVTSTDRSRQWITGIMITLSIFILLPMGLLDSSNATFGPGNQML